MKRKRKRQKHFVNIYRSVYTTAAPYCDVAIVTNKTCVFTCATSRVSRDSSNVLLTFHLTFASHISLSFADYNQKELFAIYQRFEQVASLLPFIAYQS